MLEVYALLIICTILAYMVRNSTYSVDQDGVIENRCFQNGKLILFILIMYFILFSGLRTQMNDTAVYIRSFTNRVPGVIEEIKDIDWSIGANPLFEIYQVLLKSLISSNGQTFIFVTAVIVCTLMVRFLHLYSVDFGFSIYIFISFTVFAFTMAAMKQTIAAAIGVWSIPEFVKGRRAKGFLILGIAILFHPYVAMFVAALFLLHRGIWNKRIYLVLLLTVLAGAFFSRFIGGLVSVAGMIGDEYDLSEFTEGTGVGIMRILSYMIAPALSFLSRNELRDQNNSLQDLFINFSIVAMALSILSGFGGSTLFGRLPNYFDLFTCMAIPYVIQFGRKSFRDNKKLITVVLMIAYLFFYLTYYSRYFQAWNIGMFGSVYNRTTIIDLIRNW